MGKPAATSSPFSSRLERFTALADKAGAANFLVTNPQDVGYLTGFLGGDSYLLFGGPRPLIISDFRYEEELHEVRHLCDVFIRTISMPAATAKVLAERGATTLGIQAEHMSVAQRNALSRAVSGIEIIDTANLCAGLRVRKDEHELKLIRKAIAIQQDALDATLKWLDKRIAKRPPVSEIEIAAVLESEMKSRGSSKPGFETIIAAGATGSLPHYRPKTRKLTKNMPLLIDWGAIYNGYHGDMTRVFCWGKWPAKVAEIYQIVLDAHLMAAAALKPGATTKEIDAIARGHITKHGYGDKFGHGLGHGMGLDGHEDPRLTHMMDPLPLEEGMVVTIEPGIYLPGVGGVRIEDDFVITADGAKNLCKMKKDLKWATR